MWDVWGYGYGYFHPARMEMEKGCYQQKFAEANQVLRNSKFTWSGQAQTDLQPASGNSKFTSSLGWHVSMQQKSIVLLIITPPPLWLHKKSLPWWVFSARSDKSSVAGAYILHLRKILRLLPLAVNQQSWHFDLSKSARPNVKYDFEFFHLVSLSSLKSGATSSCSIFAVELLAVGNRELHCNQASNFWESQRSCARWRTELQRHLVSTAYKTSVKKVDWWKPEGFQLYSIMGYWYCII